jgi:hypothetical protein
MSVGGEGLGGFEVGARGVRLVGVCPLGTRLMTVGTDGSPPGGVAVGSGGAASGSDSRTLGMAGGGRTDPEGPIRNRA